jgi:dTDP-4-amino-4,6-dideoxygalactose transaminase
VKVPFVDLQTQYRQLKDEVDAAMASVCERADFVLGADVEAFEREFAAYCEVPHAIGVDSGLSALELALRVLGIGAGDEVITVSHTFIATVAAISQVGATPVMVDVDPLTYDIDVEQAAAAVTPRTRAILPVHLYGQAADLDPLRTLCERHGLLLIEDACQAHGARYDGRRVGSFGEVACFSFYPGKNLGAYGDGGMIVTSRADLADRLRILRNYGQRKKYEHVALAHNKRLDSVQAAVLRVKLRWLDSWNQMRRHAAARYAERLREFGLAAPLVAARREHVYHLFVIEHDHRDALQSWLAERGVSTGLHYPVPVHEQPCAAELAGRWSRLPVTERAARRVLSLPMYPELTVESIDYVCQQIAAFQQSAAAAR